MKGTERRQKIFKKYWFNLQNFLAFHKLSIRKFESENEIKEITDEIYFCPLCGCGFFEESIYQTEGREVELTLEHNPPKNLEGKVSVLTCDKCNKTKGTQSDKVIGVHLETEDFLAGKLGAKIPGHFIFSGHNFKGDVKLDLNGSLLSINVDSHLNEYGWEKVLDQFRNEELNQFHIQAKFPEPQTLHLSVLRIAHLSAFKYLGYSYLFSKTGSEIMNILKGELKHPDPDCGVIYNNFEDHLIGLNVIKKPEDISGLLVVEKVKQGNKEKNIGVIIPAPNVGCDNLSILGKYKNKLIEFQFEQYKFTRVPASVATYYNMFSE